MNSSQGSGISLNDAEFVASWIKLWLCKVASNYEFGASRCLIIA